MSNKRLLDHDPDSGISTIFHGSDDEKTFTIETTQDVESILEDNKAHQNEGFDKRSDLWHAATIPTSVQLEWMTKFGIDLMNKDHFEGVKRLLNSSEYSYLRRNEFKL